MSGVEDHKSHSRDFDEPYGYEYGLAVLSLLPIDSEIEEEEDDSELLYLIAEIVRIEEEESCNESNHHGQAQGVHKFREPSYIGSDTDWLD